MRRLGVGCDSRETPFPLAWVSSRILSDKLLAAEKLLDLRMAELHPGRSAMVALAGAWGDLHLAQERVHLGDRKDAPGADRAVAGDRGRDEVELVAERERTP